MRTLSRFEENPKLTSPRPPGGLRNRFRLLAPWIVAAAFLALCIYRFTNFTPVPLDAPGTLRPILYHWFIWFLTIQDPEHAFSTYSTIGFIALLIPPGLAVLNYVRRQRDGIRGIPEWALDVLCSRQLLFASIGVCMLLCRYLTFFEKAYNPDEGQFIASAQKLFYDWNFFASVDCGTSGPLNIYPLMLPAVFGFTPDFASSRMVGLVVLFLIIWLLHRSIALLSSDDIAGIAILPVVAVFAASKHNEMIQYGSEYVPILLTTLSLFWVARIMRWPDAFQLPLFVLGVIACASVFSKIQVVPIDLAVAITGVAYVYASGRAVKLWQPVVLFGAGVLSVAVLAVATFLATGVLNDFWMAYIVTNLHYAGLEGSLINGLPAFIQFLTAIPETRYFLYTFAALLAAYAYERTRLRAANEQGAFLRMASVSIVATVAAIFLQSTPLVREYTYILVVAVLIVLVYALYSCRREWFVPDPIRWLGVAAVASICASLFAIHKAHRPFLHYLLYLFVPVCTAMAWMLIRQSESPRNVRYARTDVAFTFLFASLVLVYQGYLWGVQDDRFFMRVPYTIRAAEGNLIRSLTSPESQIVVWGWNVDPYLGSGRVPATRDTNMANFFRWPEITHYYAPRFLRDLKANPAEMFIDAVNSSSIWLTDPSLHGFDQFPHIARYIDDNYLDVGTAYGHRYYLRRDLVARNGVPKLELERTCTDRAVRCAESVIGQSRTLPSLRMPGHALLRVEFSAVSPQEDKVVVFTNAVNDPSADTISGPPRGFRLRHVLADRYQLEVGIGSTWIGSKQIPVKPEEYLALAIEFNGNVVTIKRGDELIDELHLPRPMADSAGPIVLNSFQTAGQGRFRGNIRFFEIKDLESYSPSGRK